MKYTEVIILTFYITYFVTLAIFKIGYIEESKPYPIWMPIIIFIHIAIPALLGYFIGKDK